jgi:hypothetical protein
MNGLGDAMMVGILLTLVFGAVCFYLWSRINQAEKRTSLLENLLLSLKMNTEASLMGPDSVEAISGPAPLSMDEVEKVDEEDYVNMLKEIPLEVVSPSPASASASASALQAAEDKEEQETESFLRSLEPRKMDVNYESMSVKELQALAKQRGITGVANRKAALIEALKRQGMAPPAAPEPLASSEGDLDGAEISNGPSGFSVELEQTQ